MESGSLSGSFVWTDATGGLAEWLPTIREGQQRPVPASAVVSYRHPCEQTASPPLALVSRYATQQTGELTQTDQQGRPLRASA